MKRFLFTVFCSSLLLTCEKFEEVVRVETLPVTLYTSNAAILLGTIVDPGKGIKEYGHIWWRSGNQSITTKIALNDKRTGSYSCNLTGLEPATVYFVKAYATDGNELAYGEVLSFVTLDSSPVSGLPVLVTTSVTSITTISAQSGGNVADDGGSSVSARGVCWGKTLSPTLSDYKTTDGAGTGSFTSNLTGLSPNTIYYLRAYATNSAGTAYGNQFSFTTPEEDPGTSCEIPAGIDAAFVRLPDGVSLHIDGTVEPIWNTVPANNIEINYQQEFPTVSAYWKGLWDDDYIYVLVSVQDDDHWPSWESGGNSWEYDRIEIYFDFNDELMDGIGPATADMGHWQCAPTLTLSCYNTEAFDAGWAQHCVDSYFSYRLTGENYAAEFKIPIQHMYDKSLVPLNADDLAVKTVGFDVHVVDQDEGISTVPNRKVWSSDGNGDPIGAWDNMDDCGKVIFCSGQNQMIHLPTVSTSTGTFITAVSALCGGNVTDDGGATVVERGICWNTSQNPSVTDEMASSGSGTGTFTCIMTNLLPNTTYYVRAYATNSKGTGYGSQVSFTTDNTTSQCAMPEGVSALVHKLPEGVIPVIDGVEEEVWNLSNAYAIEKDFNNEYPTVTAYWKALWNDDYIFLLVNVEDDDHYPAWESGGNNWDFDKPEFYFDINNILEDGYGAMNADTGHWQVAPPFLQDGEGIETMEDGWDQHNPDNYNCYQLNGENYVFEYMVPLINMYDKDFNTLGTDINPESRVIGFDVYIIDQDEGITTTRSRKVWTHDAKSEITEEAWSNMDNCGRIIFCGE